MFFPAHLLNTSISALIFLDSTIAELMHVLGQTEKDLKARHTVLE
jgi:6-phospho-3-hexuloisomerase